MTKFRKVLLEARSCILVEQRKNGKKWFELQIRPYHFDTTTLREIHNYFDPMDSKTFGDGRKWRFWRRDEAEINFTYLLTRWSPARY